MKVLVVDDHPLFLDALKLTLSQLQDDIVAQTAASASQALEVLDNERFDLLLVDLVLPDMDGAALLTRINERGIWVPAIVISAIETPQSILRAMQAGALGYIPKTFSAGQMLVAINQVRKGEPFLPPHLCKPIARLRQQDSHAPRSSGSAAIDHGITPRQLSVLELMAQGYSNKQIANILSVSEHTVKSHVKALLAQLQATNRTGCVSRARELNILSVRSSGSHRDQFCL